MNRSSVGMISMDFSSNAVFYMHQRKPLAMMSNHKLRHSKRQFILIGCHLWAEEGRMAGGWTGDHGVVVNSNILVHNRRGVITKKGDARHYKRFSALDLTPISLFLSLFRDAAACPVDPFSRY